MTATIKKWQLLEGVVAAIERSLAIIPGTRVIPNAKVPIHGTLKLRQVDVVVEIPVASRTLRIGLEVRDFGHPLDVTNIEQLGAKLQKLQVDRRCIIASRGFTSEAREESARWGLELLTIESIDLPDWWLATTFSLTSRTVELLAWRLDYSPEQLEIVRQAVSTIPGDTVTLVTPTEPPAPFRAVVANLGRLYLERNPTLQVADQGEFALTIEMDMPPDSYLEVGVLRLPVPIAVNGHYRVHYRTENVPLAAYRLDASTNAFSGIWHSLSKQLTIVTKSFDDGARSYSLSIADASPPPSHLPPLLQSSDPPIRPPATLKARRAKSKVRPQHS